MNGIEIFNNSQFGTIRTLQENGKILFCGSDVAKALGYSDAPKAIKTHCKSDGWAIYPVIDSKGRTQQAKFIDEGNLYRLICNSKLPGAEKFERWVFDEVLPSIRQTGSYNNMSNVDIKEIIALTVSETVKQLMPYILPVQTAVMQQVHEPRNNIIIQNIAPTFKIERFPAEIRDVVDDTLKLMERQNKLNYSAVAR